MAAGPGPPAGRLRAALIRRPAGQPHSGLAPCSVAGGSGGGLALSVVSPAAVAAGSGGPRAGSGCLPSPDRPALRPFGLSCRDSDADRSVRFQTPVLLVTLNRAIT